MEHRGKSTFGDIEPIDTVVCGQHQCIRVVILDIAYNICLIVRQRVDGVPASDNIILLQSAQMRPDPQTLPRRIVFDGLYIIVGVTRLYIPVNSAGCRIQAVDAAALCRDPYHAVAVFGHFACHRKTQSFSPDILGFVRCEDITLRVI